MDLNECIITLSMWLGWIAAPLIPICLLRAIQKIHENEKDYVPELVTLVMCSLVLWGRGMA